MKDESRAKRLKKFALIVPGLLILLSLGGVWFFGSRLSAPAPAAVGNCPIDLACESVEIPSESGSKLKGWYLRGQSGKGTIVLMHGLRSNRLALVDRMRFLRAKGFFVLAFDFQGSGESPGDQLTFGYRERLDAEAAVRFARTRRPDAKIGVIGISMGGAAFLLSNEMPPVDAVTLELVYPTMRAAIENRLNNWFFSGADRLTPLLSVQFSPRIGVSVDDLRPIDRISAVSAPVLVIGGGIDPFTTAEESKQLFEAANEPKQLWIVEGAGHEDLWKFRARDYQDRVLQFFEPILNETAPGEKNDKNNSSCNCLDDNSRKPGDGLDPGTNKD
ncbi:MAG: alpha/beta fold hydrolase [Acidobacteria bacterium]|nr:alpha/beta fold hydrolase [Acidobacteriota bacterium]